MIRLAAASLLAVLASTGSARADAVAYGCGHSPNVEVLRDGRGGACIGFATKDAAGKVVSTAKGVRGNGLFLASKDGRDVAFINGDPVDYKDDADGVVLFHDGKQTARYTIKDIVVRTQLVSESTSHTHWLWRIDGLTDLQKDYLPATLALTTYSMRRYEFDTATGKQKVATDADEWNRCDAIVYAGDRVHVKNGVATIDHPGIAKGKVSRPVSFDVGSAKVADDTSGVTVCLAAKKDGGWVAKERYDILFNTLPMP